MATYTLGQVAIISKGAWSASVNYAPLNTVTHNGGSFMAIAANSNKEPGVTSGWETYWVAMSRGIKAIDIVGETTTTAHAVITLSDGTTVTGTSFSTYGIPDDTITSDMLKSGVVTAAKLGTDIFPSNVGIKIGPYTPTYGTGADQITNGQIYLKWS